MQTDPATKPDDARRLRSANVRTALVLASIALVFFVGIIAPSGWAGRRSASA